MFQKNRSIVLKPASVSGVKRGEIVFPKLTHDLEYAFENWKKYIVDPLQMEFIAHIDDVVNGNRITAEGLEAIVRNYFFSVLFRRYQFEKWFIFFESSKQKSSTTGNTFNQEIAANFFTANSESQLFSDQFSNNNDLDGFLSSCGFAGRNQREIRRTIINNRTVIGSSIGQIPFGQDQTLNIPKSVILRFLDISKNQFTEKKEFSIDVKAGFLLIYYSPGTGLGQDNFQIRETNQQQTTLIYDSANDVTLNPDIVNTIVIPFASDRTYQIRFSQPQQNSPDDRSVFQALLGFKLLAPSPSF